MMALDFMAGQETARVNKEHKRPGQRARGATSPQGTGSVSQLRTEAAECLGQEEEKDCSICQVGRGMDNFVAEGIDHMECDSSQGGFTKALPKKPPNCGPGYWRLVLAGSRCLKDSETRYGPAEGELLAILFGMEQCKMFLLGWPHFDVATDHKPLLHILGDMALDQIKNSRLLAMKEKTRMYNFTALLVPGSLHFGPDASSRYPVREVSSCMMEALA